MSVWPVESASPAETPSEDIKVESVKTVDDLPAEQRYVTALYQKLDAEREIAHRRLAEALVASGNSPQARTEREASVTLYSDRLAQLGSVEQGLCFGRLDLRAQEQSATDGLSDADEQSRFHIGRLGLFDEEDDYRPLLIDWRAPVARPFYLATAASPQGVWRRRHLRTVSRRVVGLDDEILDLTAADQGQNLGLAGEAALLAALGRQRTGEMSDIVATIQKEQDEIIREDLGGIRVVQGGPGTGKTAVALHRAAYLLYHYREQLSARGVLVLGPNPVFLRYIAQVLPSLGETGVLLSTIGDLYPGVRAQGTDSWVTAEVKGRPSMMDFLAKAVRDRQIVPTDTIEVATEEGILHLTPQDCDKARDRARRSLRPHNVARRIFVGQLLENLVEQTIAHFEVGVFDGVPKIRFAKNESADTTVLDAQDHEAIRAELATDSAVLAIFEDLWPVLTPQQCLQELFTSRERLDSAGEGILSPMECAALLRPAGTGLSGAELSGAEWTESDVPLLDELAELLGEDDTQARAEQARKEREERAYAEGVLDVLDQDDEIADEETLRVADVLDAELLAERQTEQSVLTAAQRAAGDRNWTFGHVIVDEAQELSAMAWRMVMRRCPSRSMTLVGDIAQTSASAGATSWREMLSPYVEDRWHLRELTVNYRTPVEIMDIAADVLKQVDPDLRAPDSVRESGTKPWRVEVSEKDLSSVVGSLAEEELRITEGGTVAVLCPPALLGSLRRARPENARLSLLTVGEAKGLEFDSVLVVAPEQVIGESARGANDLYVALTRATQRLGIVHTAPIPAVLTGLEKAGITPG